MHSFSEHRRAQGFSYPKKKVSKLVFDNDIKVGRSESIKALSGEVSAFHLYFSGSSDGHHLVRSFWVGGWEKELGVELMAEGGRRR